MDKEIKSERITLRVTPREKEILEKKAASKNMSVSKYLMNLTFLDNIDEIREAAVIHTCMELYESCKKFNKVTDNIAPNDRISQRKIHEIKTLLESVPSNVIKILELINREKDEESVVAAKQYKNIGKQLDKLLTLLSDTE